MQKSNKATRIHKREEAKRSQIQSGIAVINLAKW